MPGDPRSELDSDAPTPLPEEIVQTPRHGFQGNRAQAPEREQVPAALSVAVSREAGSRGSSIAKRAARKLGWQVYTQELLEYIAQQGNFREDVAENLSPAARSWADQHVQTLLAQQGISQHPSIIELARIVLALGARGEVVLIGRGAGSILPRAAVLHVRIVAPLTDRVAYMSQWLRLTAEAAAEQVRVRDGRRAEFISTHFHRQAADVYHYDLVLNSGLLGEELCADLIVQAARAKQAARLSRQP